MFKLRFLNSAILELIYIHYFAGTKHIGRTISNFLDSMNSKLITLVTTTIHYNLKYWQTGQIVQDRVFNRPNH